ncbi:MAG TPA: right-handed parallel beta-helix repeat-containing protein [Anaerohalosphaeraceae bacterium]|nr:right-handed parallel beta-helix repeat-containing protein [Anaerohalosphaeraceae bacterium]
MKQKKPQIRLFSFASVLFLTVGTALYAQESPQKDVNLESAKRWEETMEQFRRQDALNSFPPDAVLFVGSSSIARWPTHTCFTEFPVINRGFGGSIYSDITYHAQTVIFPYNPRLLVLYSGDNDPFWGKTPEQIFEDVRQLLALIRTRLPQTPIILMAVKLSPARIERAADYRRFNAMLRTLAQSDERLFFFDSASVLLNSEGRPDPQYFTDDNLHLNEKGYQVWSDALRPLIAHLLTRPNEQTLYVSPTGDDAAPGTFEAPVRTLERALEWLRQTPKHRPRTVILRGGQYPRTQPLVLKPDHSGTADSPVTFRAYENEKPLLTGGRSIVGWQPHNEHIWKAEIPEVKAGKWLFTQLFVNGRRRMRARTPNEGFFRVAGFPDEGHQKPYNTPSRCFAFRPGDLDPNWTNLKDAEVIVFHFWTDTHLPIESIDADKHIVTFPFPSGKRFTDDFTQDGARYIVENVREALDAPGEWYLDRTTGTLYYWPMPDENLPDAQVIAPAAPALLRLEGDPLARRYVEHIRFEGLHFAHTQWSLPAGNCNNDQASASVPAAVSLTGARHIQFERCTFGRLGTYAVEFLDGCRNNSFTQNRIFDVAAGGIRITGGEAYAHPLLRTGGQTIADNRIGPYGLGFYSAVGILLMHTDNNTVEHNEIHHGYYTGISVGWSWGYQRSVSRDNRIAFNHIHHIGQGLLSDMGGIYTLGVSPGTVLLGNRIHDIDANRYGGWGIYNDEGSSHILIEDNLVYDTKFAGYNIHYAKEITVRNNIFAFGRLHQLSRGVVEPHISCFFERNIVYFETGTLFDGIWNDKPYEFYYRPSAPAEKTESTFEMDWNLYFNPNQPLEQVRFGGRTFEEWKKFGKDVHSRWADPLFLDAKARDFRLRLDSPALELGFRPIDPDCAGPRRPIPDAD